MAIIPRVRTPLRITELVRAAVSQSDRPIIEVESAFARHYGFAEGVLFPSARSGLYALLNALTLRDAEVLCPAYTCAVIPNAVIYSRNIVRFVDSSIDHFLPQPSAWNACVSGRTRIAITTPLFGYSIGASVEAVRQAAPGVFVLSDEAQSFRPSVNEDGHPDAALYSLGLGKLLTSLSGGMLLLRESTVAQEVRAFRDRTYHTAPAVETLRMTARAAAAMMAYNEPFLTLLQKLGSFGERLHAAGYDVPLAPSPHVPYEDLAVPSVFQARVAMQQLRRADDLVHQRRKIGRYYERRLREEGLPLFAHVNEPTWVRFPMAVRDRPLVIRELYARGIQLGTFLDYTSAGLPAYAAEEPCPNAAHWADSMINLPNFAGMRERDAERVVQGLLSVRSAI